MSDYTFDPEKGELRRYTGSVAEVVIPAEIDGVPVTVIGGGTFIGCRDIKAVTIPDGTEKIASDAFNGCRSLERIEIPDSVKYIGRSAFMVCESLRSARLPKGLRVIEREVFCGCGSLESIEIPENVFCIGDGAFMDCKSLREVKLPDGLTELCAGAFRGCEGLERINIPQGLELFEKGIFTGCKRINAAYKGNTYDFSQIKELYAAVSADITVCPFEYSGDTVTFYYGKDKTASVPAEIDGNVIAAVGERAFEYSEVREVFIPEGIKEVGDEAFAGCKELKTVSLPKSLTYIGDSAFEGCEAVKVSYKGNIYGYEDIDELYETVNGE